MLVKRLSSEILADMGEAFHREALPDCAAFKRQLNYNMRYAPPQRAKTAQTAANWASSRVREGRDERDVAGAPAILVSTHASAGDATFFCQFIFPFFNVSTHASAGDATSSAGRTAPRITFQLTRPRGTRQNGDSLLPSLGCFNSRVRGDATTPTSVRRRPNEFQLTRPRGTRPKFVRRCSATKSFNSRVRGGRDTIK